MGATREKLTRLADTVRAKAGISGGLTIDQMAEAVASLAAGGGSSGATLVPETAIHVDLTGGYVASGTWYIGTDPALADVYEITPGHRYYLCAGSPMGNRFRVMASATDPAAASSNIGGKQIANVDSPTSDTGYALFAAPAGYTFLTVGKTNQGVVNLKTYLYDLSGL